MSDKKNGIRVVVTDLETGEEETKEFWNNWMILCAGRYYVAHEQIHANGTTVLTIKRGSGRAS